jgi:DHA1 family tetracycline resistance protein-like MFS transporter
MNNKRLFNIFIIVFIDLLGFGLILPLLPFYADEFGASPFVVGLLTAIYAAAQLIGAPLLGRLSDRFGRRPILIISILGTFLGFLIFGFAGPVGQKLGVLFGVPANQMILAVLFISRALDGFTGGNISVAQAYITDVTTDETRAKGLGLVGAAFGLGFVFGPAMGGFLSSYGFAVPAFAAAALSGINLIMVMLWLPESLPKEERDIAALEKKPKVNMFALIDALRRPKVGPILSVSFFYGLAFALFSTMFSLFAQYRLDLDARQTGFVLAYVGVLIALVQGVGVGPISKRFSDRWIILTTTVVLTISLFIWAFTGSVVLLLIIMIPLAGTSGVLNTVLRSSLTKVVDKEEVGGILGISTSFESLTRVIAPSLGGLLLGSLGTWAPGVVGAVIMFGVIILVWKTIFNSPDDSEVAAVENVSG